MQEAVAKTGAWLLMGVLTFPPAAEAAKLKAEAAQGFEQYVQRTEQRIQHEVQSARTFLRLDALSGVPRTQTLQQLRQGAVVIERVDGESGDATPATPGAMIHHWMGTILLPGATLARALRVAQDYDAHQKYFSPEVVRSRILKQQGDDFQVSLRLQRTKIVTAVFETEHQIRYHRLDASHVYSESRSSRIVEVENPGEAEERELPPGEDHGFLWRLNSYWRFAEAGDGVYVQCEAVSLTRDIPTGLGWLIGPFVESIPRESLQFTLESLRGAVARAW